MLSKFLSIDINGIIAHEFGHAFAFMEGFVPDESDQESMFGELAVMTENLYRLRGSSSGFKVNLRPLHGYTPFSINFLRFTNESWSVKKKENGKWFWYVYNSNGFVEKNMEK